jgi:CRP-like cAMP-binding protein
MKMHPAEVAKELKGFLFFKSFSEDLLSQVSTLTETCSFKKGSVILKQGASNESLYFLRSGEVEVVLGEEVVAVLRRPGDVMGEMSVISKNPVATTLRALEDCEFFSIDSKNFDYVPAKDKDQLHALLYRLYSVLLSERLSKTNEKARLFEIANRELLASQDAAAAPIQGHVVMIESEKKQQGVAKVALGSTGVRLNLLDDAVEAERILREHKVDLLVCEDKCLEFLRKAYDEKLAKEFLLTTTTANISESLEKLSQLPFVDNVVSRYLEDKAGTSKALLTSIKKILSHDLFGIEKYMSWGVEIHSRRVTNSKQRDELKAGMVEHFQSFGIRSTILERVNTVAEELLMNAIFDAPTDGSGKSLYNHVSRKTEVQLEPHQHSFLRYACDGVMLAVSVEDPFGALQKEIIVNYLRSCYDGRAGSLNAEKGGAGRGLHLIIESADVTVFNVHKGARTEVICLFNLDSTKKDIQPSFHYFFR